MCPDARSRLQLASSIPCCPQSFAERGALASPAARALNAGMLLAALIHTAVELRMVAGGLKLTRWWGLDQHSPLLGV